MSERNHNRKYDPYKDPRNHLRGMTVRNWTSGDNGLNHGSVPEPKATS